VFFWPVLKVWGFPKNGVALFALKLLTKLFNMNDTNVLESSILGKHHIPSKLFKTNVLQIQYAQYAIFAREFRIAVITIMTITYSKDIYWFRGFPHYCSDAENRGVPEI